jgi:hypothetical protein
MTRTQKEHSELLQASSDIARKGGQILLGMGAHVAHIAIMPKQAALDLIKTAAQLEEMRSEVLDLANKIVDWEQNAIKAVQPKGLVDAHDRPIK